MCLNLPPEELPRAFADSTSRQLKQGRLSVVFAGNGSLQPDAEARLAEREFAVPSLGEQCLVCNCMMGQQLKVDTNGGY